MQINFSARKCNIREETKAYAEKRFRKLEKFFKGNCTLNVVFTLERENECRVEATALYGGLIFRGQETTRDFKESADKVTDILIRQIRKHKTKLEKRFRDSEFVFDFPQEDIREDTYEIIRTKNISVKPMETEEAILQMNMLGHDFYVFRETDNKVCVLYRRKDGNYGLIETD